MIMFTIHHYSIVQGSLTGTFVLHVSYLIVSSHHLIFNDASVE